MKVREFDKGYQVEEDAFFPYPGWFPAYHRYKFSNEQYTLNHRGLTIHKGFVWNGANAYPDYDWIIVPSGVHDALLWIRHYQPPETDFENESFKKAIDKWFVELARQRMPRWRRFLTPHGLFIGVNYLSRLPTGPDQAEAHRVREYP